MTKISAARINMQGGRVDNSVAKDWAETIGGTNAGNTGSAYTVDISNGNTYNLVLNADCIFTFNTAPAGFFFFTLILQQDGTGGRQVTFPINVAWTSDIPPVVTTAANKCDVSYLNKLGGCFIRLIINGFKNMN